MKYVSFGRRVVVTQFAPFSQECVCDWQTYIYFKRTKAFCVFYKKSISNEYKYICIQFHWIAKWLDAIHKKKNIRHSGVYWRSAHTPPCTYVLPLVWLCPSHSFAPLKWNPFLVESIYYVCDQRSARQRDCPTNNRTNSFWFEMRIKGIWNMFSRGADEKKVTSTMPDKSDGRTTDGGASHIYRSLNQLHLLKYNKHRVVIYLLFPASSIPRRPKHWIDEHWKWHSMSHNIMQETIMVAQDHTHIHSHLTPHTNHLHLPCITDTLNFACGAIIRLSFHCPNWIPNDFADPIDCVCACVVFVIEKKTKYTNSMKCVGVVIYSNDSIRCWVLICIGWSIIELSQKPIELTNFIRTERSMTVRGQMQLCETIFHHSLDSNAINQPPPPWWRTNSFILPINCHLLSGTISETKT